LVVRIYVDDIVFGGSSHNLVAKFADEMSREFEMSMMGELQYFLGLQIKQVKGGTFVHQTKYMKDMLRKFQMQDVKLMSTPMGCTATVDADEDGEPVDQREYRSMIGSLLYLARHTVQCVSVRSFSGLAEDITSIGRKEDLQVPTVCPWSWPLVFVLLDSFTSWFF
jgi:hypothetical protein